MTWTLKISGVLLTLATVVFVVASALLVMQQNAGGMMILPLVAMIFIANWLVFTQVCRETREKEGSNV